MSASHSSSSPETDILFEAQLDPDTDILDFQDFMQTDNASANGLIAPELLSSSPHNGARYHVQRTLAPNLTRRTHKKSRSGCFRCKARKIKCGEEKPICRHCELKGLDCSYPAAKDSRSDLSPSTTKFSETSIYPRIPNKPYTFTITDMRLFHHFLTEAYPHLPAGNDSVWTNEIPKVAEHHDYLMHAMLALGASHLHRLDSQSRYHTAAMVHRGHAIAGLNQAIAKNEVGCGEADAMLAAVYSLTFQASYMDDGITDFITMVRGCALVTDKIIEGKAQTSFNLQPDLHVSTLEPGLSRLPPMDVNMLHAGIDSLDQTLSLMKNEVDFQFHSALGNTLRALLTSTREGYVEFGKIYSVWYSTCPENFNALIKPDNMPTQILLAHFAAMQLIMAPVTTNVYHSQSRMTDSKTALIRGTASWAERIFRNLPQTLHKYIAWPKKTLDDVLNEIHDTNSYHYPTPPFPFQTTLLETH